MNGMPLPLSELEKDRAFSLRVEVYDSDEAFEELIDMIVFHFDVDTFEDIERDAADFRQELAVEFPGHTAIIRHIPVFGGEAGETGVKIVIDGPRFNFRCTLTQESITLEDD